MPRIGVYIAAGPNPIFTRMLLLQIARQTLRPNVITIYENGSKNAATMWCGKEIIEELESAGTSVRVMHSPNVASSVQRYYEPLKMLYHAEPGVDVLLKMDTDDFYADQYIENMMNLLGDADFVCNTNSNICLVRPFHGDFKYKDNVVMHHSPLGGAPSHVAFNRKFGQKYLGTLAGAVGRPELSDDELMADCTKDPNIKSISVQGTADYTYISHGTNLSSWGWQSTGAKQYFGD